jgi:lambda repressor-like predicted transcriptional regulator
MFAGISLAALSLTPGYHERRGRNVVDRLWRRNPW